LPSKLDIKKINWDELDDLLQVEQVNDNNHYNTMPSPMSSSMTDSQISNLSMDDSSSYKTLSPDGETTSQSSSIYYSQMDSKNQDSSVGDEDTPTLKPCDYEDFRKQSCLEFVNGANDMPSYNEGTLKACQPIDPSRINDSLKLYQDNIMNKSIQSEDGLSMYSLSNSFCIPGQINSFNIQDTLNLLKNSSSSSSSDDKTLRQESSKALKKSSSMTSSTDEETSSTSLSEKGVMRSMSGPNYSINNFEAVDSDTVKPSRRPITSVNIKMDCYDEVEVDAPANSMATPPVNGSSTSAPSYDDDGTDVVVLRKKHKGSTAIKRRSGNRR
jgi:Ras association domain-containing protein 2/4